MNSQELQAVDLPDSPGVYYFLGPKKQILYIGKATSLRDRVRSYFATDLLAARGPLLVRMLGEAKSIGFTTTDSVLEALILEAAQIKKWKPEYNTRDKDNKSYNYIIVTKEDFPRIIVRRGRELVSKNLKIGNWELKIAKQFGPFPHGGELREALKIIRRIFPFRDDKCPPRVDKRTRVEAGKLTGKPCFNAQIGLCPGPCADWISKRDYRKQMKRIEQFLSGKKSDLVKDIEKEMKKLAKEQKFEEAEKQKRILYALEHIQDMALIKRDIERTHTDDTVRIEAYDIAHMGGSETVGVMVVVEDGELNKSQYRKFKIKVDKNDDVNNLREVIRRRLNHPEWDMPQIAVVDGGIAQLNAAVEEFRDTSVQVVAVTKDDRHKAKTILVPEGQTLSTDTQGLTFSNSIFLANADAHRFAIGYHRKLRGKGFRI